MSEELSFYGLGIAPEILEKFDSMGFEVPTPIQHKAIPAGIKGKDLIGIAQTGTGKTIAFCVPVLQQLKKNDGLALIIVPTRELALQVYESFEKISKVVDIRNAVLIGGVPLKNQALALKQNPRVIIATPGRLIDHMDQGNVLMDHVKFLVLDEADQMFDMGFAEQLGIILDAVPSEGRQTMLFSATMPDAIVKIAQDYMYKPMKIEVARQGSAAENVTQELFVVKPHDKRKLLRKILNEYSGSVLVFSRTKVEVSKLASAISKMGHAASEIHAGKIQSHRKEALNGFKKGKYRVLVATDIAARGIDVKEIELVINYDLPDDPENYVHRIGRTGRAGMSGRSISFATPDQLRLVSNIEKLIKTRLNISKHPEVLSASFSGRKPAKKHFKPTGKTARRRTT